MLEEYYIKLSYPHKVLYSVVQYDNIYMLEDNNIDMYGSTPEDINTINDETSQETFEDIAVDGLRDKDLIF